MSLFNRIHTLVMAETNTLMDKAEEANSVPVMQQHLREFEEAIAQVKHTAAVAGANITTAQQRIDAQNEKIDHDRKNAAIFKGNNDLANARVAAQNVVEGTATLAVLQQQLEQAKLQSAAMDQRVNELEAKRSALNIQLSNAKLHDENAKSLTTAVSGLHHAEQVDASMDLTSTTSLASRVLEKENVATEEFNRTMKESSSAPDPVATTAVDAVLASL